VNTCGVKAYLDFRDWWIGCYRSDDYYYACPFPCVVIRWRRRVIPS